MQLSSLQEQVVKAAKEMIGDKHWYSGLNLDGLWDDRSIEREGVKAAAEALAMETAYWDADDFLNP